MKNELPLRFSSNITSCLRVVLVILLSSSFASAQFVRQHIFFPHLDENFQLRSEAVTPFLHGDSAYRFVSTAVEFSLHPGEVKIAFGELDPDNGDIVDLKEPVNQPNESDRVRIPQASILDGQYIFYNEFQISPFGDQSNWKTRLVNYQDARTIFEINGIAWPLSQEFQADDSSYVWLGTSGNKPYSPADSLILLNLDSWEISKLIPRSQYQEFLGISHLNLRAIRSFAISEDGEMIAKLWLNERSPQGFHTGHIQISVALTDPKLDQLKSLDIHDNIDHRVEFLPVLTKGHEVLFAFIEELESDEKSNLGRRRIYLVNHRLDTLHTFDYQLCTNYLTHNGILESGFQLTYMNGYFLINQSHRGCANSWGSRLHLFDLATEKKVYSISTENNLWNKTIIGSLIDKKGQVYFYAEDDKIDDFYALGKISPSGQNPWFSQISREAESGSDQALLGIYPNPSKGNLHLSIPASGLDISRILLYGPQGNVIREFSIDDGLDLNLDPTISNGVYYLMAVGSDGTRVLSEVFVLRR